MSKRLKGHTIAELEWDLKSWGWEYDMKVISESAFNRITGPIKAELARRAKAELKTLNDKKAA